MAEEPSKADSDSSPFRPEHVLVFDAHGTTAHFRRVEGNSTAQTYRIPPKTTIAGMISAIVGHPHDSYYNLFRRENSAIAVIPQSPLRPQSHAFIQPNTDSDHYTKVGPSGELTIPRTWGDERAPQRNPYTYLFNVSYRFVVGLADSNTYTQLKEALATRQYAYAPCLGRRECSASIDYHGEYTVSWDEQTQVDSAVPDSGLPTDQSGALLVIQEPGTVVDTERSPAEMTAKGVEDPTVKSTRKTTMWETWTLQRNGKPLTLSQPVEVGQVQVKEGSETNSEAVMFA